MQYDYNEDQQAFKDSLRKFVQDHYDYERRRELAATDLGYAPEHWQQLAELGVLGLPFAEEFGGSNVDAGYLMAVAEEFGRGLVLEPFLPCVVLAGQLLNRADNRELAAQLLPEIAAGERIATLAWEERASRGNPLHIELRAERDGSDFVLSGEKLAVLAAPQAQTIIVSARTGGAVDGAEGVSLFAVAADAVGLVTQAYTSVDGARAASLRFDGVRVSADAALCEPGKAAALLQGVLDEAQLVLGAEAQGAMDQLLELTVDYCKTRKQFGLPIAAFQALQHRMADMYIACEQTRSLLWATLQALDCDGLPAAAAMLKAQLGEGGRYVGQQAVQLHGGIGMTDELSVGAYFKRLTVIENLFGNRDYHLGRLAAVQSSPAVSVADAA